MKYVGLDIHTKNIVHTVLSENGNVIMRGKIENNCKRSMSFLINLKIEILL